MSDVVMDRTETSETEPKQGNILRLVTAVRGRRRDIRRIHSMSDDERREDEKAHYEQFLQDALQTEQLAGFSASADVTAEETSVKDDQAEVNGGTLSDAERMQILRDAFRKV